MRQTNGARRPGAPNASAGVRGLKGQWMQLGLLSASVLAPLISRWNELRAAERARMLREQAEERLKSARGLLPRTRREAQQQIEEIVRQVAERAGDRFERRASPRSRVSSKLWLVGVGVGLAAAGVGAYLLVRRQLDLNADGPLVVLPVPTPNGHAASTTGVFKSRRGAAPVPRTASATDQAVTGRTAGAPTTTVGPLTETATGTRAEHITSAKFIGDIHTMVYHEADADVAELPREEHRTYFADEEEAQAAGYRRNHARASEDTSGTEPRTSK